MSVLHHLTGGTSAGSHVALLVRLALSLVAEHLNTGVRTLWVKRSSLIPDFKGTVLFLLTWVFEAFSMPPVALAEIPPAQGTLSQLSHL